MVLPPRFLGALCALSVSLLPAFARAQVSPPPPQDDETRPRIRMGSVSLNPTIALTNIGTDSNVFNTVDDPRSDFTFTLSPAVDLWGRAGKARFAARTRSDLVYFKTYSSERSIDGGVAARFEAPLNRLVPWVEGGSYSGRQRVGYEIDLRSRRTVNDVGVGEDLRLAAKTSIGVGVRRTQTMWEADAQIRGDSLREYLNRTTDTAMVSYRQALTVLTTFVAEATTARDRFAFATDRDTNSVRGVVGFDLKAHALIDGSARVGYRTFDPVAGGFEPFRGVIAAADLGYSVRGVTRLALRADRDANFSFERVYPYYVETGVAVTVTQKVTGRWDVKAVIGRQDLAYRPRLGVTDGILLERSDRINRRGGGIGYHLNRDTRIGFNVDKYRRSSPVQRHAYKGYRIGASVTYAR